MDDLLICGNLNWVEQATIDAACLRQGLDATKQVHSHD